MTDFRTVRGYELQEDKGGLSPSLEDYLEMICRETAEGRTAHVGTISQLLHVRPSSVSRMLGKLSTKGYITYEPYGKIELTNLGTGYGSYLLWRHDTITEFFQLVEDGDWETILRESELIEHYLSYGAVESMAALSRFFIDHPAYLAEYRSFRKGIVSPPNDDY